MRKRKIILPAMYAVEHLAWAVRERVQRRTFKQLVQGLSPHQERQLDQLLYVSQPGKQSDLSWLRQPPGVVSIKNFHELMDRLEYIQRLALPLDNGREIHQNRLLQMAREGSRYSTQHLSRFHTLKRHATLMAFLIHIYAFLTDQGLHMSEKLIGRILIVARKYIKKVFKRMEKPLMKKYDCMQE
ncbi:hypothetical protein SAMN04488168_109162 [Bacillus sp. 491mf]|nr:hypothetical protein SAMN04488168_109162 [Bacillus sp. 491mf]